jgi:hypothetical protein
MSHLILINLFLILAGPFVVVGVITALAAAGFPGLLRPPPATAGQYQPTPRPRWVVAW